MTLNRRRFGLAAAAAAIAGPARAAETQQQRFFRRAVVINGNLVPPIDDEAPLSPEDAAAVRATGLTALKASLGGGALDYATTLEQMGAYDRCIALNPTLYMQVRTLADLDRAERSGRIGIIYSFESVEMLEGGLARIEEFAGRGVRVMQLSYNLPSPFASGVMSPTPSQGLTGLGRQAVALMNRIGVSIDISHSDDLSATQIMAASKKPVAVTHAGSAALEPHPRHKSDAVLRALADQGGVIGIYELSYLTGGRRQPTIDDWFAHLTHALKVCGEDHVGIGSDSILTEFATTPENMKVWNDSIAARKAAGIAAPGEGLPPFVEGLNRPDRCAVIAAQLKRRGYRERAIEKVLGLNFRRWFAQTWV